MRKVKYKLGDEMVMVPVAELAGDSMFVEEKGAGPYWTSHGAVKLANERRHDHLPEKLLARIRVIRERFGDCDWMTWEQWIDGFLCDANPGREIDIWLRTSATFAKHAPRGSRCKPQRDEIFEILLRIQVSDGSLDSVLAMHGNPRTISLRKMRAIVEDRVFSRPGAEVRFPWDEKKTTAPTTVDELRRQAREAMALVFGSEPEFSAAMKKIGPRPGLDFTLTVVIPHLQDGQAILSWGDRLLVAGFVRSIGGPFRYQDVAEFHDAATAVEAGCIPVVLICFSDKPGTKGELIMAMDSASLSGFGPK